MALALASLLSLTGLQGCTGELLPPRQSLHVLVVTNDENAWLTKEIRASEYWDSLLRAFQRLHPGVAVEISVQPEHAFAESLSRSSFRGLAPDLLLVRAATANTMLARGLVDPLPLADPDLRRELNQITPQILRRVTTGRGIAALPMFSEFTLACFDRRRVPQPPATVDELLALAASGRTVGLAVEPAGIWWTAGALGAQRALLPILTGTASAATAVQDRASLVVWLRWLRQAALQNRVDIAPSSRELTLALESGEVSWIPCFSLTLQRLGRKLGPHLGVAALPSGPGGAPTPYSSSRGWALGRDSSPQQRRLALQLAMLSLDPLIQRSIIFNLGMAVPANSLVPLPVTSSSRLAALLAARNQFEQTSPILEAPFFLDRLQQVVPPMETILVEVMVGAMTADQGARALQRLGVAAR